jgi:copper(I)-binding protein
MTLAIPRHPDGRAPHPTGLLAVGFAIMATVAAAACVAAASTATVHVTNSWIRWLPGGLPMAGYATIVNSGPKPVSVVGASSTVFGDISIHQTVHTKTEVEMLPVKHLTIAAGATVVFETAGYHIMLSAPKRTVEPGASVPISLTLDDGETLTAQFEVRNAGGDAPAN